VNKSLHAVFFPEVKACLRKDQMRPYDLSSKQIALAYEQESDHHSYWVKVKLTGPSVTSPYLDFDKIIV